MNRQSRSAKKFLSLVTALFASHCFANVTGYGDVHVWAAKTNSITGLHTTVVVPPQPKAQGSVLLWPGLQPLPWNNNFLPINNGVLQPVIAWGPDCTGTGVIEPTPYSTWWAAAYYVNTTSADAAHHGCFSGDMMTVSEGDLLDLDIQLLGSNWIQTITDEQTQKSVQFTISLNGQDQGEAVFKIESWFGGMISQKLVFKNTVLSFANPDPTNCAVTQLGQEDSVSTPVVSADGLLCIIDEISLSGADGVGALN